MALCRSRATYRAVWQALPRWHRIMMLKLLKLLMLLMLGMLSKFNSKLTIRSGAFLFELA
ncbi:hypothetical protein BOC41_11770 [Burkholderia pseudomallei]|nr:hypothetical protein BOC44_08580 [Burkholderia pseudomallei]OSP96987.1 hypothetical protein BOC41_11770 [Burkholderia pseudomallei]